MTDVLVTNAYWYRLDAKQWSFKQPYPPLGSLWAAAVVRNMGLNVSFFDNNLRPGPHEISHTLVKLEPQILVIYDDGFNYLTKMCLTVMREAAFTLALEGKKAGCTVIISSSDAADHYEKYFEHQADYVLRGEGEDTLVELIRSLQEKTNPSLVNGIAYRLQGRTIVTPPRAVIRNPDKLPLPAWDLIDIEPYRQTWMEYHGYFSMNLATTRGCPFKCNWCAKPIYGNRYNVRSPLQVVNEIELLLTEYNPSHFWMTDDIFGLKPGWVAEFNLLVKEKRLSFRYKIQSRADLLIEPDTIAWLAESGADTVWVGAESGSQKVLDAMDKGTTLQQIADATHLLHQHGIRAGFFLQFGYPGETWEDIKATLSMVLNLMPDEIGISVSYPLPGTKFYENVKKELTEKRNWSDSNDLAMMFQGTFSPAFYKILHRYVHSRYSIERGLRQLNAIVKNFSLKEFRLRNFAAMLYHMPVSVFWLLQLQRARI